MKKKKIIIIVIAILVVVAIVGVGVYIFLSSRGDTAEQPADGQETEQVEGENDDTSEDGEEPAEGEEGEESADGEGEDGETAEGEIAEPEPIDLSTLAILPESKLSEEQKEITGMWEAENGSIISIRERGHSADTDEYFELDILFFDTTISSEYGSGIWSKITRRDGSSFETDGNTYIVKDSQLTPVPGDEITFDEATYVITYDKATDTINLTYNSPYFRDYGMFKRSETEITEGDWDYYYEVHPDRQPQ